MRDSVADINLYANQLVNLPSWEIKKGFRFRKPLYSRKHSGGVEPVGRQAGPCPPWRIWIL